MYKGILFSTIGCTITYTWQIAICTIW
jgi:hypothetical protein